LGAEKPKDQSSIAKIQETRGGQIYLVEETGVPRENSDLPIVRDKFYHNFSVNIYFTSKYE
jgi:hypothetical protein